MPSSRALERAYRFNHTREVVNLINKYLFKEDIQRCEDDAPQSVKVLEASNPPEYEH
jgi:hypothetical protein